MSHPPPSGHGGLQPPNKKRKTNNQEHQPTINDQALSALLGLRPVNFLTDPVRDWIYNECALSENIEIEAKLGRLLCFEDEAEDDDMSNESKEPDRIHIKAGLLTPAIIDIHKSVVKGHFESTVNRKVFIHLNKIFNGWFANCNKSSSERLPELNSVIFPSLKYERHKTIDKIYKNTYSKAEKSSIRVTINVNDLNAPYIAIEKKKKSSLNVSLPRSKWDLRLSASIENTIPLPQNQIVTSLRCKDRISYKYDHFSIDLTTTYTYIKGITPNLIQELVHKFKNKQELPMDTIQYGTKRTYEVELEICDTKYLQNARKLAVQRQTHKISELSYFFTQASIKLAELGSNVSFTPAVCKIKKK